MSNLYTTYVSDDGTSKNASAKSMKIMNEKALKINKIMGIN